MKKTELDYFQNEPWFKKKNFVEMHIGIVNLGKWGRNAGHLAWPSRSAQPLERPGPSRTDRPRNISRNPAYT